MDLTAQRSFTQTGIIDGSPDQYIRIGIIFARGVYIVRYGYVSKMEHRQAPQPDCLFRKEDKIR